MAAGCAQRRWLAGCMQPGWLLACSRQQEFNRTIDCWLFAISVQIRIT
jgi:hypothetical protein